MVYISMQSDVSALFQTLNADSYKTSRWKGVSCVSYEWQCSLDSDNKHSTFDSLYFILKATVTSGRCSGHRHGLLLLRLSVTYCLQNMDTILVK